MRFGGPDGAQTFRMQYLSFSPFLVIFALAKGSRKRADRKDLISVVSNLCRFFVYFPLKLVTEDSSLVCLQLKPIEKGERSNRSTQCTRNDSLSAIKLDEPLMATATLTALDLVAYQNSICSHYQVLSSLRFHAHKREFSAGTVRGSKKT